MTKRLFIMAMMAANPRTSGAYLFGPDSLKECRRVADALIKAAGENPEDPAFGQEQSSA